MNGTEEKKGGLSLRILTPAGVALEKACEGVVLPLSDDKDGKGGGSIGVHKGHIGAVMALSEGEIRSNGIRVKISGGLAYVKNDVLTVISERAEVLS